MTARRGWTLPGCLVLVLALALVGYLAVPFARLYGRYFEYRDAMRQEVRFAGQNSDAAIKQRLRLLADSLGLPAAAKRIGIERRGNYVMIWTAYSEHVDLPLVSREVTLTPVAEGTF